MFETKFYLEIEQTMEIEQINPTVGFESPLISGININKIPTNPIT